jgi:hypothetical protein
VPERHKSEYGYDANGHIPTLVGMDHHDMTGKHEVEIAGSRIRGHCGGSMNMEDHAGALAVVQAMAQERPLRAHEEAERGRMADYIGVLLAAANDERDAYQLDSTEVQTLIALVGDHYDRPSVWAGNLLCAAYGHCRAPYTGGGEAGPKRHHPRKEAPPAAPPALQLHPNPAQSWVAISYLLPGHTGAVNLVVRDAQGRLFGQLTAAGQEGQRVWDTRSLAPGIYTVELRREGHLEYTERLVVQP